MHQGSRKIKPRSLRLEASTVCQLRCHTCPTAEGKVADSIGSGFLRFSDFRELLDKNTYVDDIDLSNYGEVFLNPELVEILKYAYQKGVSLSALSNMNAMTKPLAEALVKYNFRSISCSIDGADEETYGSYRKGGHFDRVIHNIEMINECKREHGSKYPQLTWQYVAFGHNENAISAARQMAQDLDMRFYVKLAWGNMFGGEAFSPIKNKELIRAETGLGVADRDEYYQKYGVNYMRNVCTQLWLAPQINFDGAVLGCCINFWGDYGNSFQEGLLEVLNNEKMDYARAMLAGESPPRDDIPCTTCSLYHIMKTDHNWLSKAEISAKWPTVVKRFGRGLIKTKRNCFRSYS